MPIQTSHAYLVHIHEAIRRRPVVLFVTLAVCQLIKAGYQLQPNFDLAVTAMAQDPFTPFSTLPSGARYVTTSWFAPALMHFIGITSEFSLIVVHLVAAVAFLVSAYWCITKYVPTELHVRAVALLGIAPFVPASFNWLGYDTIALLLLTQLFVNSSRLWLLLPIAVALGMQHFEIGLVSTMAWLVGSRATQRQLPFARLRFFAVSLFGLVTGRLIVQYVAVSSGGSLAGDDRLGEAGRLLNRSLAGFLSEPLATTWSVYGALWIALIIAFERLEVRRVAIVAATLLPVAVSAATIDSSRVGILGASSVILGGVILNPAVLRVIGGRLLIVILLVFLLVPRVWIWDGTPRNSCFSENIAVIVDRTIGIDRFIATDCRIYYTNS